jgi:hypothetical protein
MGRTGAGLVLVWAVLACAACDDPKKAPEAAAPSAAPSAPAAPPPEPEKKPEEPQATRPAKIDLAVTADRRAKAEAAVPEAKGFLVATELEEKLKANKKLKEKTAGVTAFDKLASGKWVLFEGPMANLTDSGFDIGITYTPQIPGDVMGMSRQWFPVTLSDVKGYDSTKFKVGQTVVVLAKYAGKQKATPGTELVEAKAW